MGAYIQNEGTVEALNKHTNKTDFLEFLSDMSRNMPFMKKQIFLSKNKVNYMKDQMFFFKNMCYNHDNE